MRRHTALGSIAAAICIATLALIALADDIERPWRVSDTPAAQSTIKERPTKEDPTSSPAFVDPGLAQIAVTGEELRLSKDLQIALGNYERKWAALAQRKISPGPPLGPLDEGPRVHELRARLGLDGEGSYDAEVSEALRDFQAAHGLSASGLADVDTLAALNAGVASYIRTIKLNLKRAAQIPVTKGRWILVDAASARLWMYEDDRQVGTMPVIVGKPDMPTPMLFGLVRYAVFNPYWNVPPDLASTRIAQGVLDEGPTYLDGRRFEILSDWSDNARPLDASAVDWKAVRAGTVKLRVRQLPGADNMMGAVKFMSPNPLGIYLHDTPNKALFREQDRHRSSGCIRVPDAPRLARWLFDGEVPAVAGNDIRSDLPAPIPVYVTYLTAIPEGGQVKFTPDIYERDVL